MTSENTLDSSAEAPTLTFNDFALHSLLLQSIIETGYTRPTPIQAQAIPMVIAGRDVMGAAQTGTGKTAAFTVPILNRLMPLANASASPARHPVRALVLAPTRELADQVGESVKRYAKKTPLRSTVVFGGVDIGPQREALRQGCEVLVATPGRLLDHVEQKNVNLSQVQILVLDEADRMLDMGFLPDLERIMRLLPDARQTLLFSATFSNDIRKLGRTYLKQPVELEVAARNATAENVTQIAYLMSTEAKRAAVVHLVKSRNLRQVIVFSNTKIGTARLARHLELDGVRAESIHGDKTQADRMKALEAFKAGELEVLVATDVAARGLDVAGVPCVINYDLPYNAEDYVHRIGRTGRAGASGAAIALYTADEERYLFDIEKLIKRQVPRGTLEVPSELVARSHGRSAGERAPREARAGRPPRESREGRPASEARERGRSASRPGYGARQQPVDDFFLKPYEPAANASRDAGSAPADTDVRSATPRKQTAVLLGGGKKPVSQSSD